MRFFKSVFIFTILINSCTTSNEKPVSTTFQFDDYLRSKELSIYLKNEWSSEIKNPGFDTLYFIPLNSCDRCVQAVLKSLIKHNHSGTIIVGGNPELATNFTKEINQLSTQHFLIDSNYTMQKYNLDIYGPTVILHGAGKKPTFLNLDYKNWEFVTDKFGWK